MAKATEVHRTVPNHLNREFEQVEPGKALVTDMTYLPYRGGETAYLSCVKDVATREIVAYELSTNLRMNIVYRTLSKLKEALDGNVHPEALIHSDQGFTIQILSTRNEQKKLGYSHPCHGEETV